MRDATYYARRAPGLPADATVVHRVIDNPRVVIEGLVVPWQTAETAGEPLYVMANHGRWVVSCSDCGGAQLGSPTDPRFMCLDCGNAGNGGRYRPVVWPKQHEKIAALLDARADVRLRNWLPGESVRQIRAENEILEGSVL